MPGYYATSKYDLCAEIGSDIITYVSLSVCQVVIPLLKWLNQVSAFPRPSASLVVADVAAAKVLSLLP